MASDIRQRQVAKRIQQRIASLLQHGLKDPRNGFITITGVTITKDLTLATVRWSVFDPAERPRTESLFAHAHGFLRTEVARDLQLREAPQLVFEYDRGIEHAEKIERILKEVLPPKPPPPPPPAEPDA